MQAGGGQSPYGPGTPMDIDSYWKCMFKCMKMGGSREECHAMCSKHGTPPDILKPPPHIIVDTCLQRCGISYSEIKKRACEIIRDPICEYNLNLLYPEVYSMLLGACNRNGFPSLLDLECIDASHPVCQIDYGRTFWSWRGRLMQLCCDDLDSMACTLIHEYIHWRDWHSDRSEEEVSMIEDLCCECLH